MNINDAAASLPSPAERSHSSWPDYAAIWRWHFYAGLLCLPFFCWLALTGSVYLFRRDIEAWLDRPYESLRIEGHRATPSSEVLAAITAVPGSVFTRYEPPRTPTGAAQVVVSHEGHLFRVYVHPGTLRAIRIVRDDHRIKELIAHLHGQLLLGAGGSMAVELAGSWGVVMIVTGFYLWLPRSVKKLGGVLYPRLWQRGRLFWRDLHAVTGLWISLVTLFMLLSGLPWAVSWGNYLTWIRNHWPATAGAPDWPIGGRTPISGSPPAVPAAGMPSMTAAEMSSMPPPEEQSDVTRVVPDLQFLNQLVPIAARLHVPRPIWISPPARGVRDWTISSQTQNRPLRITYSVAPDSAAVTGIDDFDKENIVDKVVNVAVATHEGQLFGRMNQAILLLTAVGLLVMSVGAVMMWWRRRPADKLGAPVPLIRPRFSASLAVAIVMLALVLPLFGLSLLLVVAIDRSVLRYLPGTQRWLGLTSTAN